MTLSVQQAAAFSRKQCYTVIRKHIHTHMYTFYRKLGSSFTVTIF